MSVNIHSPWGNMHYISQSEAPYANMLFGRGTVRQYGCGACCTANIAMRLGIDLTFIDVIAYYTFERQPTRLFGILPWKIKKFFDGAVFNRGAVRTKAELRYGLSGFNKLMENCRYVIAALKWRGRGAHYIACMKNAGGGLSIIDPAGQWEDMHLEFADISDYLKFKGGGFVIGGVGVNQAEPSI